MTTLIDAIRRTRIANAAISLWRAATRRRRFERELDAELEFHRLARSDDLIAQGFEPAAAHRLARVELGMQESHRDACRRAVGLHAIDTVARDLRYAVRGLWRNPGYSVTALFVLGTALGANALLFALFSAYGLRAPPVQDAARWVTLETLDVQQQLQPAWRVSDGDRLLASPPAPFAALYTLRDIRLPVTTEGTRAVCGEVVSPNYFEALGIGATQGRLFAPAGHEDEAAVVLSELGRQRLLAGVADPIGRTIEFAGRRFTVIGVADPAFTGTTPISALFWMQERDYRRLRPDEAGEGLHLEISGVLRETARVEEASAALQAQVVPWNVDRPIDLHVGTARVEARGGYLRASDLRDLVRACLPIGFAFVLLLLVAAANLANLVLARFASRQRELAVRVSVGAPRRRLFSQLLVECALLATLAAALGFGLARVSVWPLQHQLFALMGDFGIDLVDIRVDATVFLYVWGLALVAALTFGGLPAWLATAPWRGGSSVRPDLAALKRGASSRLRSVLMVAQLAVSVALLVLASLIAVNARVVERTELGFDPSRTIAVHPEAPDAGLLRALESLPSVQRVALASRTPLLGKPHRIEAAVDGRSEALFVRAVDAAYFEVFALDVIRGRALSRADADGAPVAMISRRTAQRLWPDQDPLGRVIDLPPQEKLGWRTPGRVEVVGVVEDVVSAWFVNGIDASALYLPTAIGSPAIGSVLLRTHDSSPATLDAIAQACVRALPDQNCELLPMLTAVRIQRLPFLIASRVAAGLGWIALGISCIGLYGLVSYLVLQKRREIGVRLALGAAAGRVAREMLRGAARQIALGVAIGVPVAFALTRLAGGLTDQLRTFDPLSFLVVPLGLAAIALGAAWIPARRTAAIAPTEALRED